MAKTDLAPTNGNIVQLPKITDLYEDTEMSLKENKLLVLLNAPPKDDWVKENPFSKNKYIERERVEWLLIRIFGSYKLEVRSVQVIANSVCVTVRLYVTNPVNHKEEWQDGVGAAPMQTDKEAGAMEWNKIKASAVQMAAPAAETFAFKDAAEKFGKLFGRDISSKNQIDYTSVLKEDAAIVHEDLLELFELKKEYISKVDLKNAERILKDKETNSYKKLHNQLKAL